MLLMLQQSRTLQHLGSQNKCHVNSTHNKLWTLQSSDKHDVAKQSENAASP